MRFGRTVVSFIGLTVMLLSAELWLKDGLAFNTNRIVFTFYAKPDHTDVYVMDADGENRENLTNHPAYDGEPDWSPDGGKIAFTVSADRRNEWEPHIAVMDADGKNRERLEDSAEAPSWSPDGREIAFMSRRAGGVWYHIYVIGTDGQGLRRVTHHLWGAQRPAFSPDGKRIAYKAIDESSFSHIFVVNADGTDPKRLTQNQQWHGDPAWSPSGRRIAYNVFWDPNRDGASTIHLMTSDGQYLELLSTVDDAYDAEPDISPLGLAVSPTSKTTTIWGRLKKRASNLR